MSLLDEKDWASISVDFGGMRLLVKANDDPRSLWSEVFETLKKGDGVKEVSYVSGSSRYDDLPAVLIREVYSGAEQEASPMNLIPIIALVTVRVKEPMTGEVAKDAECAIWLDGQSMVYVTRVPFCVYDVRGKLEKLLANKMKLIPPHFIPMTTTMFNGSAPSQGEKGEREIWYTTGQQMAVRGALAMLSNRIRESLGEFYFYCTIASRPRSMAWSLQATQDALNDKTDQFSGGHFWSIRQKRKLRREMRKMIASILSTISFQSRTRTSILNNQKTFEQTIAKDLFLEEFFTKAKWRKELSTEDIDREVALMMIENSRQELQYSGMASMTLWAAVIGVVGIVIGFVLSYLVSHP